MYSVGIMTATILKGDCLEVMKGMPSKSIDLFVCDLPYGCLSRSSIGEVAEKKKVFSGNPTGCDWDVKIDLAEFWKQVKRLCKNDHTPVLMFCNMRFGNELINSNPDWFRYDLVWNKLSGTGFLLTNKMPMRSHEMIFVFSKKGAKYNRIDKKGDFNKSHSRGKTTQGNTNTYNGGKPLNLVEQADNSHSRCVLSVIEIDRCGRKKGNHPTAKPIDLYKWLIERYSNEGDTVLDPTFGSGNSGKASTELNRKYIGIEKDTSFFWKAASMFL